MQSSETLTPTPVAAPMPAAPPLPAELPPSWADWCESTTATLRGADVLRSLRPLNPRAGDSAAVLVDVGTGYFIEKSVEEAQAFLTRKMGLIESQAQTAQSAAQFKNNNLWQTVDVMNRKIMEMRAGGGSSSEGGGTAI